MLVKLDYSSKRSHDNFSSPRLTPDSARLFVETTINSIITNFSSTATIAGHTLASAALNSLPAFIRRPIAPITKVTRSAGAISSITTTATTRHNSSRASAVLTRHNNITSIAYCTTTAKSINSTASIDKPATMAIATTAKTGYRVSGLPEEESDNSAAVTGYISISFTVAIPKTTDIDIEHSVATYFDNPEILLPCKEPIGSL